MKYFILLTAFCVCASVLPPEPPMGVQERIVAIAQGYVGITDDGNNKGKQMDYWNARLGLPAGSNYCASFIAHLLDSAQASYPTVRSGVAQHYITRSSIRAERVLSGKLVPPGYIAVWKRGDSWMGHTEIIKYSWRGKYGMTIGANTTPGPGGDQRQGRGVYVRERHIDPTAFFRLTHITPTR